MKRKAVVPKIVRQYIEEEFDKNPEFRKAYKKELSDLHKRYKIVESSCKHFLKINLPSLTGQP